MSHVLAHWNAVQGWIKAHGLLFAVAAALVATIGVRYAAWSAVRSIRRRDRRYEIAKGRQARARGLSLTSREADLLAHHWWRRSR